MTVQLFYEAPALIDFPYFDRGIQAPILSRLYWQTASDMMVAMFRTQTIDRELGSNGRYQLQRLWRDGTQINIGTQFQQAGYPSGFGPWGAVNPTTDGRLARAPYTGPNKEFWAFTLTEGDPASLGNANYYVVDALWPGNLLAPGGRVCDDIMLGPDQVGLIQPSDQSAWFLEFEDGDTDILGTQVSRRQPSEGSYTSTVVFGPVSYGLGTTYTSTYQHFRSIIPVDASTVCVLYRPADLTTLVPEENQPAIIRVFDYSDPNAWVQLWEDELPGVDQVATFDPVGRVLYSCGKRPTNAVMHASKLKRQPYLVAVPTGIGVTELPAPGTATISTLVMGGVCGHNDSMLSVISGELVLWTLDPTASGGTLASNYSLTNNLGQASITYVGPATEPAAMLDQVCATVALVARDTD